MYNSIVTKMREWERGVLNEKDSIGSTVRIAFDLVRQ